MSTAPSKTAGEKAKIEIFLKATGNAPILKNKKWQVHRGKKIEWIAEFLRKTLKCDPSESIFLYINQAFAPSPDREIGSLYESYGVEGRLIIHYAKTEAWG